MSGKAVRAEQYSTITTWCGNGDGRFFRVADVDMETKQEPDENVFPETVIVNNLTTTVIWKNGDKTSVTCMDGDNFHVEDAIVQAYFKYMLGNTTKRRERWMKAAKKRVKTQKNKEKKVKETKNVKKSKK